MESASDVSVVPCARYVRLDFLACALDFLACALTYLPYAASGPETMQQVAAPAPVPILSARASARAQHGMVAAPVRAGARGLGARRGAPDRVQGRGVVSQ